MKVSVAASSKSLWWNTLGLLFSVGGLVGCGPSTGDISGKVTFKTKPLNSGHVMFLVEGQPKAHYGEIKKGGTYTVENVPAGPAKVTVSSPDPLAKRASRDPKRGRGAQGRTFEAPKAHGDWFPIPKKYSDLRKSGLTFTVKKGSQTHNIELVDPK